MKILVSFRRCATGTGRLKNGNPPGDLRLAPRCGAKTRAGGGCRQPAMANGRCRLHGGRSTGPRTEAGRARCAAARTRHGLRGKSLIALRREGRRRGRRMAALRDEGLARQAIENGVAPPTAWFRRVAAGRTFAELVAAEIAAARRPRRKGEDPPHRLPAARDTPDRRRPRDRRRVREAARRRHAPDRGARRPPPRPAARSGTDPDRLGRPPGSRRRARRHARGRLRDRLAALLPGAHGRRAPARPGGHGVLGRFRRYPPAGVAD
jgi:hypothetical protein